MTEWTNQDTVDALVSIHKIDVDRPKSLYESALAKGDLDQAYRICYAHCDHYWSKHLPTIKDFFGST